MKNKSSYRLPAILLAVILAMSVIMTSASAGNVFTLNMGYKYDATESASITYVSGGASVSSVSEMNPNKTNSIIITVPDSDELPQNGNGVTVVTVPDYVTVTAADANACSSDDVTCEYRPNANQVAFKWSGEVKAGFTAEIPVTPNAPATMPDVSGNKVLVVKSNLGLVVTQASTKNNVVGANILQAVVGQLMDGRIYASGTEVTVWHIERLTGDWYSISNNGLYITFGNDGSNISLTGTPCYFLYANEGGGSQFIGFSATGEKYYLNNKSHKLENGIRASTWNDQHVELYSKLETNGSEALVSFNANGGSAAPDPILTEKGNSITLPAYNGSRSGNKFMGWALTNDVKVNTYYRIYQPGETFAVTDSKVTIYAVWSSLTAGKAQFGIRLDGTIPDEPAQYGTSSYTPEHIVKEGIVKDNIWKVDVDASGKAVEGNHVVNSITANLTTLPTDEEIKSIYSDYDPDTMYIHWYVMKWASGLWHVDGVVVMRSQEARIRYSANVPNDQKTNIKNVPASYATVIGTELKIGSDANGKQLNTPEYPDHIFEGWTTTEDGSGEVYQNGDSYKATGSVTFYAKWIEIPKYKVLYSLEDAPSGVRIPETMYYEENGVVTLADVEERDGYIFSGWMVNGEKLEGTSFKMPNEAVTITGAYYGPISVRIKSDWPDGKIGYWGAQIKLTAILTGAEGLDCTLQWQYVKDGEWVDLEGATGMEITYVLNEETSERTWQVLVTDVKPHQD